MHAIGRRLGLFLAGLPATAAAPRTFVVNSTVDVVDRMAGDGQCASNGHACTLRAAIEEANAHPGADTVQLPGGTFEIEIPTLWSVTALVQSMYSGANHGFRNRDATENGGGFEQVFNRRETSQNQPQLVITFG